MTSRYLSSLQELSSLIQPKTWRKLSDDTFLATFGESKGPTPCALRPRPKTGSSILRARASTTATVLAARLERLTLAARKTPRTRLNFTARQARDLNDWPHWLDAIRKELKMLKDMGCYEEVSLADVLVNPKTGRHHQIIPTKMDLRLKHDAWVSLQNTKGGSLS